MPTTNFALPTYTTSDTAALDTLLNGQVNAIDAALLATEGRTIGTDAQRIALTSPRRKEGLEWYSTDTDRDWRYDGSNWVSLDVGGQYIIRPTSVVNGTINADGSVTVAGAAAAFCELRGVFSSRFSYYRVLYKLTGTPSAETYFRWVQGASLYTLGSGYSNSNTRITTGSAIVTQFSLNSFGRILDTAVALDVGEVTVLDPTDAATSALALASGMGGGLRHDSGCSTGAALTVDGIAFSRNAGTITGTLKVYGIL